MIERWKDIPGYDGKYQASTEGNIRRTLKSGQFRSMTPYHKKMKGSQRLVVKLTKDGKAKEEIVLSLIARTFLGPVPDGAVPYHKNGMQSENHINNIAYISFNYVEGENSSNDVLSKYSLSSCIYCPESGPTLISLSDGHYFSYNEPGNYIEDYKNKDTVDISGDMTKEEQLVYYFEHCK